MEPHAPDRPLETAAQRHWAREVAESLLVAVVFARFVRTFLVQAFQIPSSSMERDLLVGDHILVNKFIYGGLAGGTPFLGQRGLRRGDVVVFQSPEDPSHDFIKRCVGLPGDRIEIVDKRLFINRQEVDDSSYAWHDDDRVYPRLPSLDDMLRLRDNFGPYSVPADSYFCLGDNRDNSRDSRFWGSVPAANVKGRALLVYWSYAGQRVDGGGMAVQTRDFLRTAASFFVETRWRRCLTIVR